MKRMFLFYLSVVSPFFFTISMVQTFFFLHILSKVYPFASFNYPVRILFFTQAPSMASRKNIDNN